MEKVSVRDLNVENKVVIVRVDFNVPIQNGAISDDNRIVQALPTIEYLIEKQAKVVLMSHLGKVKTEEDKIKNNLAPVAVRLEELLKKSVTFVPQTRGELLETTVATMKPGDVVLIQNTRYEAGESKNDEGLGKYWASLGDLFVEDAFGSVHRAHASTVGIPTHLPSAVGFLVEKELKVLGKAIEAPERPLVAILGGAKVSDKIGVIENLLKIADKVIIGGGMAYTFYKAMGREIGTSLLEADKVDLARTFLEEGKGKLILPIDTVVSNRFGEDGDIQVVAADSIPEGYMGLDIGPKTLELFKSEIEGAKTVIWNGPMGVFEMPSFAKGTIGVCQILANLDNATTIIGGGDSAAAAIQLGFANQFTHISTGGGASLELMEGKVLPGIAIINEK